MRALYCPKYGPPDVLEMREVPKPALRKGHVIVRVAAVAVTSGDARIRAARFPKGMRTLARLGLGIFGPRHPVPGMCYAGEIVAAAPDVTGFVVGQRVMGMTGMKMGACADFVAVSAKGAIITLPDAISFEQAAAMSFGGTTALHFLKHKAQVQSGERVLVLGASGQVGSAGVQIAKHLGAHVTAVCSGKNADVVHRLGADEVIDYTLSDPLAGAQYDVIMSCVGSASFAQARGALREHGRFLLVEGALRDMITAMRKPDEKGRRTIGGVAAEDPADLQLLVDLAEAGDFDPLVTATYPLEQASRAHALVDSGRKVGSVVLTV